MMVYFYLLWIFGYFLLLLLLVRKWPSEKGKNLNEPAVLPSITLVIPFRNEANLVGSMVEELKRISPEIQEILLVDDQSEDDSFSLFSGQIQSHSKFDLLKSPGVGKKAALEWGIRQARGEIILTSDADCSFAKGWAKEMATPFQNPEVQLVAGPVLSKADARIFPEVFQQIEWASILLVTQFSFRSLKPLLCSGANLAFRKSAFLRVGGYMGNDHLLSGDDEFLLKKIAMEFGAASCLYLPYQQALVYTLPEPSLYFLFNQRIRWASKWKEHGSLVHGGIAILAALSQWVWLFSFVLPLAGILGIWVLVGLWAGKLAIERWALQKVLRSFGRTPGRYWALTSLFHPFYVIGVSLGSIWGKFEWKGRSN
ncbi:glycosyltransferase [Algoriphagus confluentis]|uniref:Glycosyltransferase n=1 Tax=Algoriphagus confluentis TaxID=1697556 RepID=A0ABQ6PQU0_9BACT|nr:glycosyltransferase [Algoriphagus confluentis]